MTDTSRLHSFIRSGPLRALLVLLLLAAGATPASPYSVQTHEQLVDLTWKDSIEPLLLTRYPHLTPQQLLEAHAYAYGGCAIQDLGYYPFGNHFVSDLTHYVRTGDFVLSLIRNSKTPDELAFAIGALSHYVGDTLGHSAGVNPSVGDQFPSLRRRYGPNVTYEDNKHAHIRTEFAFDIDQIAKHRFAPADYLEYVGLQVPERLLDRAFFETYGLELHSTLGSRRPVIRGYRFAVRRFLPNIARAEVLLHQKSFPPDSAGPEFDNFQAELSHSDFEGRWNQYRASPGVRVHLLAALIFVLPKVGTLSDLAIRGPDPQAEDHYIRSVNLTINAFRYLLRHFDVISRSVPNRDLDTGIQVAPGAYKLTDRTYATLVHRLARNPSQVLPLGLKQDIALYYADPSVITTRDNPGRWAQLQSDIATVKAMPAKPDPDPPPPPADATVAQASDRSSSAAYPAPELY